MNKRNGWFMPNTMYRLKPALKYRISKLWQRIKWIIEGRLYGYPTMTNNDPLKYNRETARRLELERDTNPAIEWKLIEGWWCIKLFNGDYLKMHLAEPNPNQLELPLEDVCQCQKPARAIGWKSCLNCDKVIK